MTNLSRLLTVLNLLADVATGEIAAHRDVIAIRVDLSRLTAAQATRLLDLGLRQDESGWVGADWYLMTVDAV